MKKLVSLLFFVIVLPSYAQDYLISFSGAGLTSVKVENLTSGMVVNLNSGDVLHLSATTSIAETTLPISSNLGIYPNPTAENSTIQIIPPRSGNVIITVYGLSGKIVTESKDYLDNNIQEYDLSGLSNGLYLIRVKGDGFQFSGKLLSAGNNKGVPSIARGGTNIPVVNAKISDSGIKGLFATVDMVYKTGERLKYTGYSGNNSTVITDIPSSDKTIGFSFAECKDGSNNYYSIVQIGTQTWMAENLKTTRYSDGTDIPLVTENAIWNLLKTPGFCWYKNDEATYKPLYGALYNWYAVNTGKLCPAGWHVPTRAEWITLENYLVDNGYNYDGTTTGIKIAKALASTTRWIVSNITGAPGNSDYPEKRNATGFTALPGHRREGNGVFQDYVGYAGWWWSASKSGVDYIYGYFQSVQYNYNIVGIADNYLDADYGMSVRCVRNQ